MSRAAQSKSRAEKKGGPSAPTPAVTQEIVPGKFTDVDWNRQLEFDDCEDFIGDVVDELMSNTLAIIHQKYIERQLLPYTISQAKEAILTIIDWQFLARDEGEPDPKNDTCWQEDEEPACAVADCWAQGSVPRTVAAKRPASVQSLRQEVTSVMEETIHEESEALEPELEEQPKPWEVNVDDISQSDEALAAAEPITEQAAESAKPTPPTKAKRKPKYKPHRGRLLSAGVSNMAESMESAERRLETMEQMRHMGNHQQEETQPANHDNMPKSVGSILKNSSGNRVKFSKSCSIESMQFQSGRPPGNRDVYYDEAGNIVAMSKINPDKLPTHRIRTRYHIVDPSVEASQARLDAMRTGRYQAADSKTKQQKPRKTAAVAAALAGSRATLDKSSVLDYHSVNSISTRSKNLTGEIKDDGVTPLPPPLIESMELAPGVVVKEGHRVKKGPRMVSRTSDRLPAGELLRPVGDGQAVRIHVKELIGSAAPHVRIEPTPIPSITNKQRSPINSISAR